MFLNILYFSSCSVCQWSMTQVGRTPIPSPWHEGAVFSCYDSLVKFQETFPFNDLPFVELFSSGMAESGASVMLAYRCSGNCDGGVWKLSTVDADAWCRSRPHSS